MSGLAGFEQRFGRFEATRCTLGKYLDLPRTLLSTMAGGCFAARGGGSMRFSRFGRTLTCLVLVTAMFAPAGASAARRNQKAGLTPSSPVGIAWSWLARMLGVPLQAAVAGSAGQPGDLDQGPGIDPIGGQGVSAATTDPELERGWGIDPDGEH